MTAIGILVEGGKLVNCVGNAITVSGSTAAIGIKVVGGSITTASGNTIVTTVLSNVLVPGASGYVYAAVHLGTGAYWAYRTYRNS